MTNPNSIGNGAQGLPGVDPAKTGAQAPKAGQAEGASGGPAFQVLLERLQAQAQELETTSRTLEDPSTLAGAVDMARASLDDAHSLSDRLLEAFREAQTQDDATEPSPALDTPEEPA